MLSNIQLFYNNRLYRLLSNPSIDSNEILEECNSILHDEPDLVEYTHPIEGSFFHLICRKSRRNDKYSYRMIYSLSNAGCDPNIPDQNGNTPLHQALIQGVDQCNYDLIQALFRVGVDQRIMNNEGKTADAYLGDNPQLQVLYKGYGDGIWSAIETSNIDETERLIKGFIKIDCKHNSNKTLLDKVRDLNCTSIINILGKYQVTNEFVHSIIAFDWQRASIIYKYEENFLNINSFDTIHRLTFVRTYSKSILEYCLESQSSQIWQIFDSNSFRNINVDMMCTDGQPWFFHCLKTNMSDEMKTKIFFYSNMFKKSSKGETFLFNLLSNYIETKNNEDLNLFIQILSDHPLLLAQRNQFEETIIEWIYFQKSLEAYRTLEDCLSIIFKILVLQLRKNSVIEQFILQHFGYYLLFFYKNKTLKMTKYVCNLLCSLKNNQGLIDDIVSMQKAIRDNDLIQFQNILQTKSNTYYGKDSFGRTCAHLAVLYQRYDILKYIGEHFFKVINVKDNLLRTSYHYACIMNDQISIDILKQAHARQMFDCLNYSPNDYRFNRDLCSDLYTAEDFAKTELQRTSSSISNFLKIAFYPKLKLAIEKKSIDDMKILHNEIVQLGFHLKDLTTNSSLNDYIQGQRYIPLLFIAIEHRSIAILEYLFQLGLPLKGQMYISNLKIDEIPNCLKRRCLNEEFICVDIIDLINDFEDDIELKNLFDLHSKSTHISIENDQTTTNANLLMRKLFKINRTKSSSMCVLF